jgi:hypothetical protein
MAAYGTVFFFALAGYAEGSILLFLAAIVAAVYEYLAGLSRSGGLIGFLRIGSGLFYWSLLAFILLPK